MTDTERQTGLRQMLTERIAALEEDLRAGLRHGRDASPDEGRDSTELSDDHISGDLGFALLEMKSETIAQLKSAVLRLDAGHYGVCAACGCELPQARLAAMPFAVRCQPCADRRERAALSTDAEVAGRPHDQS